jgi:hypothetical protein
LFPWLLCINLQNFRLEVFVNVQLVNHSNSSRKSARIKSYVSGYSSSV